MCLPLEDVLLQCEFGLVQGIGFAVLLFIHDLHISSPSRQPPAGTPCRCSAFRQHQGDHDVKDAERHRESAAGWCHHGR